MDAQRRIKNRLITSCILWGGTYLLLILVYLFLILTDGFYLLNQINFTICYVFIFIILIIHLSNDFQSINKINNIKKDKILLEKFKFLIAINSLYFLVLIIILIFFYNINKNNSLIFMIMNLVSLFIFAISEILNYKLKINIIKNTGNNEDDIIYTLEKIKYKIFSNNDYKWYALKEIGLFIKLAVIYSCLITLTMWLNPFIYNNTDADKMKIINEILRLVSVIIFFKTIYDVIFHRKSILLLFADFSLLTIISLTNINFSSKEDVTTVETIYIISGLVSFVINSIVCGTYSNKETIRKFSPLMNNACKYNDINTNILYSEEPIDNKKLLFKNNIKHFNNILSLVIQRNNDNIYLPEIISIDGDRGIGKSSIFESIVNELRRRNAYESSDKKCFVIKASALSFTNDSDLNLDIKKQINKLLNIYFIKGKYEVDLFFNSLISSLEINNKIKTITSFIKKLVVNESNYTKEDIKNDFSIKIELLLKRSKRSHIILAIDDLDRNGEDCNSTIISIISDYFKIPGFKILLFNKINNTDYNLNKYITNHYYIRGDYKLNINDENFLNLFKIWKEENIQYFNNKDLIEKLLFFNFNVKQFKNNENNEIINYYNLIYIKENNCNYSNYFINEILKEDFDEKFRLYFSLNYFEYLKFKEYFIEILNNPRRVKELLRQSIINMESFIFEIVKENKEYCNIVKKAIMIIINNESNKKKHYLSIKQTKKKYQFNKIIK